MERKVTVKVLFGSKAWKWLRDRGYHGVKGKSGTVTFSVPLSVREEMFQTVGEG